MKARKKQPLIYLRRCDHRYIAVVTLPSGKRLRRGTGCRHEGAAWQFADLLQKHVIQNGAAGNLFPQA